MEQVTRSAAVLLMLMLLASCERDNASTPPAGSNASAPPITADAGINEWLLGVLEQHGLPARIVGNWVEVGDGAVRVNGAVEDAGGGDRSVVQLAMRLRLHDGRILVQPVVGMGKSRDESIQNAEASFLIGTLHVWLAAFINADEDHLRPARRTIGGRERLLTQGDVLTKSVGDPPKDDLKWRDALLAAIDASNLPGGAHWIDVYHGIVKGEKAEMEIQLDNARWTEMETKMRGVKWPDNGMFTSVRLYLVVQDVDDPTLPRTRATTRPATQHAAGHDMIIVLAAGASE